MEINKLVWKIGGEAGYGTMTTGLIFSKCCSRGGLNVFDYAEYPSLIRGGHNTYTVRTEDREIYSQIKLVDLLVALNKETIDLHKNELTFNGAIIYDHENINLDKNSVRQDIRLYQVPLLNLAREYGGDRLMTNSVSLGVSMAIIDYDFDILVNVISDIYKDKGEKIVSANINAAKGGYDYVRKNIQNDFKNKLRKISSEEKILLTGNEALSIGAIKAGCKFVAIYPMTPTSSILHYMTSHDLNYSIVVKQPEDEIAGINMAIGASFAGARAMVATSGGGFCLMTEALGLAAITETPIVIIVGQRGGPSTGLPTWTEQGDLRFVLHASQGDFPRIVLAPGDVDEFFYNAIKAFELAEKYHLPVIIFTDKYLAESHKTTKRFDDSKIRINRHGFISNEELNKISEYKRFRDSETGVSLRAVPGQKKGIFMVTSDEHQEDSLYNEEADNRKKMMDKRFRKLDYIIKEIPDPVLYGDKNSKITIIGWGSTKGPILEGMRFLKEQGINVRFLHLIYLNPFPVNKVSEIINDSNKTIVMENNKTGQLCGLIKEKTGKDVNYKFLKYDGRPFYPEEVLDKIKEIQ